MESLAKGPDPWKKEKKNEGGVQNPEPMFSFKNPKFHFTFWYILMGVVLFFLVNALMVRFGPQEKSISFSEFKQKIESGEIKQVQIGEPTIAANPSIHTATGSSFPSRSSRFAASAGW